MTTVLSPTAAPERIPADEWQAQLELAATFRLLAKLGWGQPTAR
ncbi:MULTISPECIES: hypothetical protein [unclassified Rhodococcus (in: high G+C Gram-positive bacteria)]|nr:MULTISPECIES: hypothetical protein [unclassified Rhodococcus (in: high G+C Gram-positive bacteria)]